MEFLLTPEEDRLTIFPLQHPEIWNMYKKAVSCFWTSEEIDLSKDLDDWVKLSEKERRFIKKVLAFFSSSDTIVNMNLAERFVNEVQPLEAKFFYNFQEAMENIHSEVYSLLIDTYIKDPREKNDTFHAVEHSPAIRRKADWCLRWIRDHNTPFAQRLIAFAIVEGVFFSGSFCAIFWIKEKGKLPGLCFSNELISRDEGMHVEFAVLLYSYIRERLPAEAVVSMMKEAVHVEKTFVEDCMPEPLLGMNAELMGTYIEFVADRLMVQLGYDKIFQAHNPFPFMERISIETKSNFFEARVGEYAKANVGTDPSQIYEFSLDADF
jgi:ribonucleotide reductase beta subunit family protein with ferritin-like domain